ncbi:MAG: gliding motility-associated C-terminal domain-containing protein [Chitinophagales bacterium]|nr:gliding motility-associated C-terminal domain-containing protein [Chitinophagales bacterium]MDW8393480.1 gliding motility-associated C-terminal domain-containing protein [Chitinophagales bacterium]
MPAPSFCRALAFLTSLFFKAIPLAHAQLISGVVNDYAAVLSISGSQITVNLPTLFNPGDYVLLIQMQGADINTTNNASFGDITAYNQAGNFEFGKVASVSGSIVELTQPLIHSYQTGSSVQLIRVPAYCRATVVDTLTCKPWDGSTGGVLAVICYGALELQSVVNVSGKGFRSGPTCVGGWGCGNTNYYLNNVTCNGGKKGEGIYLITSNAYTGGRGKIANGGGGGNPGNCGGGGGANYGAGGLGGYEYNLCFNTIQGIGGQALDYTLGKIFMGGAGGTGFNDNMQTQFAGGNGGGIVMLICDSLIGNGYGIYARGNSVNGVTNDESAGGGGAGGVVCLDAAEVIGSVTVSVQGGKGGDTYNNIFVGQCHGPGGGGGGGVIWLSSSSMPTGITAELNGGAPGLVLNPLSTCYNTSWGATAGSDGNVLFDFPGFPFSPAHVVSLIADTMLCPGQQLLLSAGSSFLSFEWNDGTTDSVLLASAPGTYYVTVTDSAGCLSSDTVTLSAFPPVTVALLPDSIICPGDSLLLIAGGSENTYLWSNGATDSSLWVSLPGWYGVEVTDTLGCTVNDSALIVQHPITPLNLGDDFAICQSDSAVVYAGNYASYLWSNFSTDSAITVKTVGLYWVMVTDSNGCVQSDSINLLMLYPLPPDSLMADTVVCPGAGKVLQAPAGYAAYLWNTGTTDNKLFVNQAGSYWLEVTDENGCRNRDTFFIDQECPTEVWFPNAFTPNGDGVNDEYRAIGYNINRFSMTIYNRWGEVIFVADDLNDAWNGWCNGVPCEIGVYVFHAEYSGELHGTVTSGRRKGNITLLR